MDWTDYTILSKVSETIGEIAQYTCMVRFNPIDAVLIVEVPEGEYPSADDEQAFFVNILRQNFDYTYIHTEVTGLVTDEPSEI